MSFDFVRSRRIVNPGELGNQAKMARYLAACQEWRRKIDTGMFDSASAPSETPEPEQAIAPPPTLPAPGTPGALADKADTKPAEVSEKGTEIIVSLGESFDALLDFHFIHTSTKVAVRPSSVSLGGQCIRWLLARRKVNTTYADITLREFAQMVADAHGLVLEMEGDGPKYAHLDQTGLSDFGLLHRECQAIGFYVSDGTDNVLKIGPLRPNFTGFVIEPWMLLDGSLSFGDEASADMPANRNPSGGGMDAKAEVQPDTGAIAQVRIEDSTGTANGAADSGMGAGATGDGAPKIYGTVEVSNEKAGLPTQETGAIALANGEEITAESLKEEVQRVQGYASSAKLKMTEATLTIVPGNIIALSPACAGGVFAREWRVSTVQHEVGADAVPSTTLGFYTPQEAVPKKVGGGSSAAGDGAGSQGAASAQGYAPPHSDGLTYIGDGIGPRGGGRMHRGFDFAGPYGTPVLAMKAGTVIDRENGCSEGDGGCAGGFGNLVTLQHDDGIVTHYAHLQRTLVNIGDSVAQGQTIGEMGSTGRSSGPHSHIEFRRGDQRLTFSDVGLDVESFAKDSKRAGFSY